MKKKAAMAREEKSWRRRRNGSASFFVKEGKSSYTWRAAAASGEKALSLRTLSAAKS